MRIIPVASGKGGVGKSLVAANLGVAFAQAGQRVVLADLDLGASNLHLVLGHQAPRTGVGAWLRDHAQGGDDPGGNDRFDDVIAATDVPGLRFIPGDMEIPGAAHLKPRQLAALTRRLLGLRATTDVLILDLGAGSHQSILDLFLLSSQGVVVSAPAVTAVLTAYVFLKNAVFRLMSRTFEPGSAARACLDQARGGGAGPQRLYVPRLLPEIRERDGEAYRRLTERLDRLRPRLLMNMVDDPRGAELAGKIRRSCAEYLALRIEHLGVIYRDSLQDTALASRLPITLYKPQSLLAQAIYRAADKILASPEGEPPDDRDLDASFREAATEAEVDFGARLEYVEELLHSGALSEGDLVETVKSQQIEIAKIRRENAFLKRQLSRAFEQGYRV